MESFDVRWLEENETDARVGPDWLFDYAELFKPFYVHAENTSISSQPVSCELNLEDENEEVIFAPSKPSHTPDKSPLVDGASDLATSNDEPVTNEIPPPEDVDAHILDSDNLFNSSFMEALFS